MWFRLLICLTVFVCRARAAERPHVLWMISDDNGPQMGCYGDPYATTPALDRLAARGMRYNNAWSVSPVCAPARAALITGMYPSSTGALHTRGDVKLPESVRLFPQLLREAGYYCTNRQREDYNLEMTGKVWDDLSAEAHWRARPAGQPFFSLFNLMDPRDRETYSLPGTRHDPARAPLPPYWPDTPEIRKDWARYYDRMTVMDSQAGTLLDELEKTGLAADTIIIYCSDHGPNMPRCKRTVRNSGLRVPLLVYFPEKWRHLAPLGYKPGGASDRLVSFVDFAPTFLSIAGVPVPAGMQGRAFAGPSAGPDPEFLHGMRDRIEERYDPVRAVRDQRYVYVRNYLPHHAGGQDYQAPFEPVTTGVWRRLFLEGRLTPVQSAFWLPHPPEELFDLVADPFEVENLAGSGAHRETLERLRAAHVAHERAARDVCLLPEAEMFRRAGPLAPLALGHDDIRYPLEAVLRTAQRASSGKEADLRELRDALKATDPAIRWWAVMGHLAQGKKAVQEAADRLVPRLKDDNASVRIAAAEVLATHGRETESAPAFDLLLSAADVRTNDYFDTLRALNALDDLRERLTPRQREMLASLPVNREGQNPKTADCVKRLLDRLAGRNN